MLSRTSSSISLVVSPMESISFSALFRIFESELKERKRQIKTIAVKIPKITNPIEEIKKKICDCNIIFI